MNSCGLFACAKVDSLLSHRGGCGASFLLDIYTYILFLQKGRGSTASTQAEMAASSDGAGSPTGNLIVAEIHRVLGSPTGLAPRRALPLAAALEGAAVPVSYTVGIQPGHRGRNVLRRKAIGRSLGSPLVRQHRKGGGRKLLSSLDVQPLGLLTQAGLKVPRGKVMSSMPDVSSSENTSRQAFGRPCFETRLLASRRPRAASGVLRKRSVSFL